MDDDAHVRNVFQDIVALLSERDGVTQGKMLKATAIQVGGKAFAFPSRDGIVFKLPKAEVDALQVSGQGAPLVVGKRTMREWIVVRPLDKDLCLRLAEHAYRFVANR